MSGLNMDDPFGFHKSLESGVFKLEGVGKLYGQEGESELDGLKFRFTVTVHLCGTMGGEINLVPVDQTLNLFSKLNSVSKKRSKIVFSVPFRLEGECNGSPIRISNLHIVGFSGRMGISGSAVERISAKVLRLELGIEEKSYDSALAWIPNLEFGGCDFIQRGKINFCQFSFPSIMDGLEVELRQLQNYEQLVKSLKASKSSVVTSVCNIHPRLNKTLDEIQTIFREFFFLVSFATGQCISPIAYWFRGTSNMLVIENRHRSYCKGMKTWCNYSFPLKLAKAINDLFPKYISCKKWRVLVNNIVYEYLIVLESSRPEVKITFLSRIYESLITKDKILSKSRKSYPLDRGFLKELQDLGAQFLDEKLAESLGDDAEKAVDFFKSRLNTSISKLTDKSLQDKIKALFQEQEISYEEQRIDRFVYFRNKVAHGGRIKSTEFPEAIISIQYMLRLSEILILKLMDYLGDFLDRWKDIEDPKNSPHIRPFEQVLEELKRSPPESE